LLKKISELSNKQQIANLARVAMSINQPAILPCLVADLMLDRVLDGETIC
jgi:hypothetical protein